MSIKIKHRLYSEERNIGDLKIVLESLRVEQGKTIKDAL